MTHLFSFSFYLPFVLSSFCSCFDVDLEGCRRYLFKVTISALNGRAAGSELLVVVWVFAGGSSDGGCKHRQVTGALCC